MWPNPHSPADLVTFTEEILNKNLLLGGGELSQLADNYCVNLVPRSKLREIDVNLYQVNVTFL